MLGDDIADINARGDDKKFDGSELCVIVLEELLLGLRERKVDSIQAFNIGVESVHEQSVKHVAGNLSQVGIARLQL